MVGEESRMGTVEGAVSISSDWKQKGEGAL